MVRFGSTSHGACCTVRLRGWAAARRAQVPGNGGLTSRSSRCRFAARLNSGVRPCFPHCRYWVPGSLQRPAHPRRLHIARAVNGVGSQPCSTSASDRHDSPQDLTGRVGCGQGAVRVLGRASRVFWLWPRRMPASGRSARLVVLFGSGVGLLQGRAQAWRAAA